MANVQGLRHIFAEYFRLLFDLYGCIFAQRCILELSEAVSLVVLRQKTAYSFNRKCRFFLFLTKRKIFKQTHDNINNQ